MNSLAGVHGFDIYGGGVGTSWFASDCNEFFVDSDIEIIGKSRNRVRKK